MPDLILAKHTRQVMEDPARHKVIVAHRRWGKTSYGIKKIIICGLQKPKGRYFYIAPTYKQSKMIAWKMLEDFLLPLNVVKNKNETELRVELKTNTLIELKGSDYPDSLRGVGLDGAILDEWSMQSREIFTEILRPALADKEGWSDKLLTPKGRNHAYDDFIASGQKHFYPASVTGIINPVELLAMRQEMSEDEYNQEMECLFLYHAGAVYKEFDPTVHVIKPFDVRGELVISIDYGLRNPTAVVFCVLHDGIIYVVDEIYEAGKEVREHAAEIKRIWRREQKRVLDRDLLDDDPAATPRGCIDPSTNAKTKVQFGLPYSIYQEFHDNGIVLDLAPNAVIAGINLIKQLLSQKRLFIFDRCENLIKEIQEYRWKEKSAKDANLPEEPCKVRDHLNDGIRYLAMSYYYQGDQPVDGDTPPDDDYEQPLEKDEVTGYPKG